MKGQYFRLDVDAVFRGWTRRLPWSVRACWPAILAIVKAHGNCGEIGYSEFLDWAVELEIPGEHLQAFLLAAGKAHDGESEGAIVVEDGVLRVTKWSQYQTDPRAAQRMRDMRDRKKGSPVSPSKEETDTDTERLRVTSVTGVTERNKCDGDETGNVCTGGIEKPRGDAPQVAAQCCQHVRRIHDAAFPPADRSRAIWPQAWNAKVTDAVVSGRIPEGAIFSLTPDDMKAARKLCRDAASWGWGWVEKYMAARSTAPKVQSIQDRIAVDAAFKAREEAARAKLLQPAKKTL